ncbi:MAG: NADH-quinone oxidoreductase subunit C [SAR202 cluster bacterium]|jgi:NADH-quinone oxidoreductase subunit C|nr:NADH-quinone oxidoreductase subunit C [SAR202 cluster bacterium]|tara:strand:- start:2054 stop:2494 length:441 start_codon:yes stop_codon:yes gene_type:complete
MTKLFNLNTAVQDLPDFLKKEVNIKSGSLYVNKKYILEICSELKNNNKFQFNYLKSISAVDYIEFFEVVYHLDSFITNTSLVLKSKLYGREGNSINSVRSVWKGAELQEREIWDLMGIFFDGHPNMKRILLWEGFKGHPLRKDFLK